jgi:PTS system sucrose-specific EIIBC component
LPVLLGFSATRKFAGNPFLGAAGFLGIPSIKPDSLAMYSIGIAISFIVAFSLSTVLVKRAQTKA